MNVFLRDGFAPTDINPRTDKRNIMDKAATNLPIDRIQEAITDFGYGLRFDDLSEQDKHAVKIRLIDTLGGLIGAFDSEPCRMTRDVAKTTLNASGSTIFGTDIKINPEMAAFTNATTARFLETNDVYFPLAYSGCHPSDMIMPILAVAESVGVSGRDLMTAIVLGYEIYSRVSDKTKAPGFDQTNFVCMGTAVAAAKLMGLSRIQMNHALSIAVVPNNSLYQSRRGHLTMWKAVAAGQAGRNGIFAAILARAGIEGAHLPFEGEAGWCDFVARNKFTLDEFGGRNGASFRIHDSRIKIRAACAQTISPILAAEKIAPACKGRLGDIESIKVETFASAKRISGTGEQYWNPQDRETADHSIPYVMAATLIDGTIGPRQFDDSHLWNAELRGLI